MAIEVSVWQQKLVYLSSNAHSTTSENELAITFTSIEIM